MRVRSTEEAAAAVRRVAEQGHEGLAIVVGSGCCDGTAPYLFDRYTPGRDDLQVGEVAGVPVFALRWIAELHRGADEQEFTVGVQRDVSDDSFSLETEFRCRLILHQTAGAGTPAA